MSNDLLLKWHGRGARTVNKTRRSDLGVVQSFAPDMVILQLGTNGLSVLPWRLVLPLKTSCVYSTSHTVLRLYASVKPFIGKKGPLLTDRLTFSIVN